MKRRVTIVGFISALLISSHFVYAGDTGADEDFVTVHGAVNRTFVESIAKNRASKGEEESSKYLKVDGNEEFQEALNSGQFENPVEDSSSIQKQYIYRDIQNVDLDDRDLQNLQGDTLNLGSEVEGGNVEQYLNIEDSSIDTDKHINAGISASSDASDMTNVTNIDNSKLSGGSDNDDGEISTSKFFD